MEISNRKKRKEVPRKQVPSTIFVSGGLITPGMEEEYDSSDDDEAILAIAKKYRYGTEKIDGVSQEMLDRALDTVQLLLPVRVLLIDIGQGNATLILGPSNESILIDCGSVTEDAVANELVANARTTINGYLKTENKLDYLIISHPDKDHVNKVHKVLAGFTIGTVLCGGVDAKSYSGTGKDDFAPFLESIDKTVEECLINGGDSYTEAPDLPSKKRLVQTETAGFDVLIVAANAPKYTASAINEALGLKSGKPGTVANCSSVVVCVRYQHPHLKGENPDQILVCADATFSTEYHILEKTAWKGRLGSFLLSGGHHGSADSFSPNFLKEVSPSLVHFSANMHGRFRHPTWEVVARIREHCPAIREFTECGPHEIVIGCTIADKPLTHEHDLIEAPTVIKTLLTRMHEKSEKGATVLEAYVQEKDAVDEMSPVWLQQVLVEVLCKNSGKDPSTLFESGVLPSVYHGRMLDIMLVDQKERKGLTFTEERDAVVYWDSNITQEGLISSLMGANTGLNWMLTLFGDRFTAPEIENHL